MEERGRVQQAIIDAGRRLLSTRGICAMSMREIAREADCSPALLYRYFRDLSTLVVAIRQLDMDAATDVMERVAAQTIDPAERVRQVFLTATRCWLEHGEHFDVLFSGSPNRVPIYTPQGVPFGKSSSVLRSIAFYSRVIDAYLETFARRPIGTRLALDTLVACTHGPIAHWRATPSLHWSPILDIVATAIDALLSSWRLQADALEALARQGRTQVQGKIPML